MRSTRCPHILNDLYFVVQFLGRRDLMPAVEIALFGLPVDAAKPWKSKPCRSKGSHYRFTQDNVCEFKQVCARVL
jgi:hypothetical protein